MQEDTIGCLEANDRDCFQIHIQDTQVLWATQVVIGDLAIGDYAHESMQMIVGSPVGT